MSIIGSIVAKQITAFAPISLIIQGAAQQISTTA